MDIFKVLSRGTKPAHRANDKAANATSLPSAGTQANPQLYHDVAGPKGGKKRKRKAEPEAADDGEGLTDSDVDFFAPKKDIGTEPEKPAAPTPESPKERKRKRKAKLLDEDECRQILKSHRLKFTVVPKRATQVLDKGKKKKQDKTKATELTKDDKKQAVSAFPQPLNAFAELGYHYDISAQLAENIDAQGFRAPTEVQMGSLPLLMKPSTALAHATQLPEDLDVSKGVDFMAVAPTGSGKTISFLIPVINKILQQREGNEDEPDHELEAIVLAPTRELASQIANEGRKLALNTGIRVALMKKGMRVTAQETQQVPKKKAAVSLEEDESEDEADKEDKKDGSDEAESSDDEVEAAKPPTKAKILVATPKLLLNFLIANPSVKKTLPQVRALVLDEADVLLDPLFRKQTLGIWKACTHPELQLSCWSATMASNVEALVTDTLAKRSHRNKTQSRPLFRLVVGLKDTAVPNITHKLVYAATEAGKLLGLRQLLHPTSRIDNATPLRPPFLVFTQTIERAQALHKELKYDIPAEAGGPARIAVLHSSLSDSVRSRIMARFRAGEVWVLITTDVLARGVDFVGVNGVVNYDVPTSAAAYVHRAGRTGRAGREGGIAVTYYTKDDIPFVKSVANVIAASEKQAGKPAEGGGVQKWLLDALPNVKKADRRKLKTRGVESRRTGGKAGISTRSAYERRKANNLRGAIEGSKRRKELALQAAKGGGEGAQDAEWGGLDDA